MPLAIEITGKIPPKPANDRLTVTIDGQGYVNTVTLQTMLPPSQWYQRIRKGKEMTVFGITFTPGMRWTDFKGLAPKDEAGTALIRHIIRKMQSE